MSRVLPVLAATAALALAACGRGKDEGVISASVLQQPVTMGRWGVRAAISYLEKKPVPPVMFTGLMTATKENLDSLDLTAVRAPAGWTPPTR